MKNCKTCVYFFDNGGELFGENPNYMCDPHPENIDDIADGMQSCQQWIGPRLWHEKMSYQEWREKIEVYNKALQTTKPASGGYSQMVLPQ